MKHVMLAAALLALAGCQSRTGISPLYSANSQISAANMLINSLSSTVGTINRTGSGRAW